MNPRKANDAMHLALLLDAPIGELILQGPVILSEKSVLPGVQKARERHTFLFETALLICKERIICNAIFLRLFSYSAFVQMKFSRHFVFYFDIFKLIST